MGPAALLRSSVAAAVVFAVLLALARSGVTVAIDGSVTALLDRIDLRGVARASQIGSLLGDVRVAITATALLSLVLLWRSPRGAWIAPWLVLLTGVVELTSKWASTTIVEDMPPALSDLLAGEAESPVTFPSGHVARVSFLAVVASDVLVSRPARALLAFGVVLTGFARMFQGAHTLTDVGGGLALGLSVGTLALAWIRR